MSTKLFMAKRTNYNNYDFSNENWKEVSLQEAYNELCKYAHRDYNVDSQAMAELRRVEHCPNEVVRCMGGLLFQLEPDDSFDGWNLYS